MASIYNPQQRSEAEKKQYETMKTSAAGTVQNSLDNGYVQNLQTRTAYQNWQDKQAQKPADYSSTYTQQLDSLLQQITNRPKFAYDVNQDQLYRQARDQYMLQGRQAMKDTIGQASAMTGGYGNSYAASAGNQAYQQYLTQLAAQVPDFYDRALNAYNAEGDRIAQQYAAVSDREATDYGRYRDTVSDWNTDVDRALNQYTTLYNQDYGQYADRLSNAYNALGQAENVYQADRAYDLDTAQFNAAQEQYTQSQAQNVAMQLLGSGQMPSADLLTAAGISTADAQSFIKAWKAANTPKVTTTASRGTSNNNNNNNKDKEEEEDKTTLFQRVMNAAKAGVKAGQQAKITINKYGSIK